MKIIYIAIDPLHGVEGSSESILW